MFVSSLRIFELYGDFTNLTILKSMCVACVRKISHYFHNIIRIFFFLPIDNTVPSITVIREGLFGSTTVNIRSGSPPGTFDGFAAGKVLPDTKLLSFTGSKINDSFSVQVSRKRENGFAFILSRERKQVCQCGREEGGNLTTKKQIGLMHDYVSGSQFITKPRLHEIILNLWHVHTVYTKFRRRKAWV